MDKVAFIPLRAGGSRVGFVGGVDKERAELGGHPLMAWTIRAAIDSGIFDKVFAVVKSPEHMAMAKEYGAEVLERPGYTTEPYSPDTEWVLSALKKLLENKEWPRIYSILRVTSPFRTAEHIKEADKQFGISFADSLRTVTPVSQHPGKMWIIQHTSMLPLLPFSNDKGPWHSNPTQELPEVYIQTAGMEMAASSMTLSTKTISGSRIWPYVVSGPAALDINTRFDWDMAEKMVENRMVELPEGLK